MRLLIASAESDAPGYAPRSFIRGLAAQLAALGIQLTICAYDTGPYHRNSTWRRFKRYCRVNASVMRSLGRHDAILTRAHFAHLPWTIVAALRGKPVIHMMNGLAQDASTTHRMGAPARALAGLSYRIQFLLADHLVAATQEIADKLHVAYKTKGVSVICNGVDSSIFRPVPKNRLRRPYAIYPSSLALWHDMTTVFDAVKHPDWPEDLEVLIVGDGANTEEVKAQTKTSKNVRYLGLAPSDELRALMQQADMGLCLVLRLASRNVNEVYPLKLLEMMACGIPVVVTDLPGQSDVIRSAGAGEVVPERDAAALARAVSAIHGRPDRGEAMGLAGASYVEKHFNWSSTAARLDRLLRELVGGRAEGE